MPFFGAFALTRVAARAIAAAVEMASGRRGSALA
jgi:hypothetical protein